MRLFPFIIILLLLGGVGLDAKAQVPDQIPLPEQWQLTLDVIKSKAQTLMVENNGLQVEYRELSDQVQKLQQSIDDFQNKNDQMDRLIKERHGQTDQQARMEELTQIIKTKRQEARIVDEQLGILRRKQSEANRKIQTLKHMFPDAQVPQEGEKQNDQSPVDDQLTQLRKKLEDNSKQEVLLANELEALKSGDKTQNLNVDDIEAQNRDLEARLDVLRLHKLQHGIKPPVTVISSVNGRRYDKLKKRKEELEANIYAYESRLDDLRQSSLTALSWTLKKKKMVHDMVLTDARNNQIRMTIKELHEDIDVLRDQVAKLERRADFVKSSKEANFVSTP